MSLKRRRELLAAVAPRYREAKGNVRTQILDEFVATTGYLRTYAIRLLNHPLVATVASRNQKRKVGHLLFYL